MAKLAQAQAEKRQRLMGSLRFFGIAAVVVIGGVFISTLFTLYLIPCVYAVLSRFENRKSLLEQDGLTENAVHNPMHAAGPERAGILGATVEN